MQSFNNSNFSSIMLTLNMKFELFIEPFQIYLTLFNLPIKILAVVTFQFLIVFSVQILTGVLKLNSLLLIG